MLVIRFDEFTIDVLISIYENIQRFNQRKHNCVNDVSIGNRFLVEQRLEHIVLFYIL